MSENIELWKCEVCDSACVTHNHTMVKCGQENAQDWQPITVTIQEQPQPPGPQLEDLKFGDEIEAKRPEMSTYSKATYICHDDDVLTVLYDNVNCVTVDKLFWRLPLKNRMKKGQPIVIIDNGHITFFNRFEDEVLVANNNYRYNQDRWRLPTKKELSSDWLTEG